MALENLVLFLLGVRRSTLRPSPLGGYAFISILGDTCPHDATLGVAYRVFWPISEPFKQVTHNMHTAAGKPGREEPKSDSSGGEDFYRYAGCDEQETTSGIL